MEGCLGASNEGSVSPETVRRWIVNVDNVLVTETGRKNFQDFLENSGGFEDGLQLLTFWEMCHEIVPDETVVSKKKKKKKWFSSQKAVDNESIYDKAEQILRYANENIDFDPGLLHRVDTAIKNKEYENIISTVIDMKKESALLLKNYHELFKNSLLLQHGIERSS